MQMNNFGILGCLHVLHIVISKWKLGWQEDCCSEINAKIFVIVLQVQSYTITSEKDHAQYIKRSVTMT